MANNTQILEKASSGMVAVRRDTLDLALRLIDAVIDSEYGGVTALDIHGHGNWFDVRSDQINELREALK